MNLDRIATLLASNLPANQVASIVGVSPARISQIAGTAEFKELLAAKQIEVADKDDEETAITNKYMAAEHMLLNQVMDLAPISELRDVTAALRVVAERQERAKSRINPVFQGTVVNQQNVINLSLPAHAIPEIHLSKTKEVLAIGDSTLAPMTSKGVTDLFASLKGEDHVQVRSHEEASRSTEEAIPFFAETGQLALSF